MGVVGGEILNLEVGGKNPWNGEGALVQDFACIEGMEGQEFEGEKAGDTQSFQRELGKKENFISNTMLEILQ